MCLYVNVSVYKLSVVCEKKERKNQIFKSKRERKKEDRKKRQKSPLEEKGVRKTKAHEERRLPIFIHAHIKNRVNT